MEKVEETINTLIKLQELDAEIYKLREARLAKPAEKQALEEEFEHKRQGLKAKEEEAKSLQLKRKDCEITLESKEGEIKKHQAKLFQIKTNREYLSLQKEIENLKADNGALEDDILELMEKIDKNKAEIGQEKERLAAEEKRLKEEIARLDQEVRAIDQKSSSLEQEREKLKPNIEKGLLSRYERILKAKNGLALVAVLGESCGGCNRVLPPQVINETRMKDRIVTCEFCARLLYWPE